MIWRNQILITMLKSMLLVVIIATPLLTLFLDNRAGHAFQKIELDASENDVISLMGTPSNERKCTEDIYWNDTYYGSNDGRCISVVRYSYFLSTWAIGYSEDRHVVSKFHNTSE